MSEIDELTKGHVNLEEIEGLLAKVRQHIIEGGKEDGDKEWTAIMLTVHDEFCVPFARWFATRFNTSQHTPREITNAACQGLAWCLTSISNTSSTDPQKQHEYAIVMLHQIYARVVAMQSDGDRDLTSRIEQGGRA